MKHLIVGFATIALGLLLGIGGGRWYYESTKPTPVQSVVHDETPETLVESDLAVRTDARKSGEYFVKFDSGWKRYPPAVLGRVGYANNNQDQWGVEGRVTRIDSQTITVQLADDDACQEVLDDLTVREGKGKLCGTVTFGQPQRVLLRPATWDLGSVPLSLSGTMTDLKVGDVANFVGSPQLIQDKSGTLIEIWGWQ